MTRSCEPSSWNHGRVTSLPALFLPFLLTSAQKSKNSPPTHHRPRRWRRDNDRRRKEPPRWADSLGVGGGGRRMELTSHLFTHDRPPTSCKRMCLRLLVPPRRSSGDAERESERGAPPRARGAGLGVRRAIRRGVGGSRPARPRRRPRYRTRRETSAGVVPRGTITATRRRAARVRTGLRGRHGDCNGLSGASPDGWGGEGMPRYSSEIFSDAKLD